jgi:glutamyl-tRNA synthetase
VAAGRFAPSPTGPLHLGNLRTALVAWLFARSAGSRFWLRVEDLDAVAARPEHEAGQQADLVAVGLDWDPPVVRQSARRAAHDEALARLDAQGLVYPCFCTRREIREAAMAAHGDAPGDRYPGICRELSGAEQARRARSRPPALRLRAPQRTATFQDRWLGEVSGPVDDVVLRRNDGTPAYNLAVVVDDAEAGVEEVVRGDDLVPSTPAQVALGQLLGLAAPTYVHVALVLAPDGRRLAKRDGAVTLADLAGGGVTPGEVAGHLAASLGLAEPGEPVAPHQLLARFDPDHLPRSPWVPGPPFLDPLRWPPVPAGTGPSAPGRP